MKAIHVTAYGNPAQSFSAIQISSFWNPTDVLDLRKSGSDLRSRACVPMNRRTSPSPARSIVVEARSMNHD
jgi:hypothetical protein